MDKNTRKQLIEKARHEAEKKRWEGINLYPTVDDVLDDPLLGCVFRPVLTTTKTIHGKELAIHIMVCLGTIFSEEKHYKYSENGFFGFQYNKGKYVFLGSKEAFQWEYSKMQAIFEILHEDFQKHSQEYLAQKLTGEKYQQIIMDKITPYVHEEDSDIVTCYLENFYSYELVKYHYQHTGVLKTYNELTKGWGSSQDFFYSQEDIKSIVDEFFMNLEYNVTHEYNIDIEMACFGMETFDFMANKCMLFALADSEQERIYLLEYYS